MEALSPKVLSKRKIKVTNRRIVKFVVIKYSGTHCVLATKRRSICNRNKYVYNIATMNGIPVMSTYEHYIEDICKKHIENLKVSML